MLCEWVLQMGHSGDACELATSLCKHGLGKGDLFVPSWARVRQGSNSSDLLMCGGGECSICGKVPRYNRCVYMVHVCFYVWCSDCVGSVGRFVV